MFMFMHLQLKKVMNTRGILLLLFLLSSFMHLQTQTFQNSRGSDSASSCTGSTGFLKAVGTDKKVCQRRSFNSHRSP